MADTIQEYQIAKQNHRNAEIGIAKAKAQMEVYQKDIANILASEGVSSIEELSTKLQEELKKLEAITSVLNKETAACTEVLTKLGAQ